MALTTGTENGKPEIKFNFGNPDGEVRLDFEGKGYWHSFKKEKAPEPEPEKPVATKLSKKKSKKKIKSEVKEE